MKKRILLSLAGILCFGMLFCYNLTVNDNSLEAENIEALAKEVKKDLAYNMFDPGRYPNPCGYGGVSVCYGN